MATNPIQELEQNARRRKLMEAMQMQAMSGAPTGGANAKQAIIQALARAGMGLMAGIGQGQLDASDTGAREGYSQALEGEMNKFMDTRQGTPETPLPPDLAGPPKPGMPADPRRAIVQAMTSQYPEMRELGKLEMIQQGKAGAKPSYSYKGGKVLLETPEGVKEVGTYGPEPKVEDEYGPLETIGRNARGEPIQAQRNLRTKKYEYAPGGGQSITVNANQPGPKAGIAFSEKTAESYAPGGKGEEAMKGAQQSLMLTREALAAINEGASSGVAEPIIQTMRKIGTRLGIEDAATTPTEVLSSALKQRTFARLGGLGTQISDADRKFLQEAQGDISMDPAAMKRLLALSAAADMLELQHHKKQASAVANLPGMDPELAGSIGSRAGFDVSFGEGNDDFGNMVANVLSGRATTVGPTPPKPGIQAPPAQPISLKEYLKKQRGGK